jgi:hypothetical protein
MGVNGLQHKRVSVCCSFSRVSRISLHAAVRVSPRSGRRPPTSAGQTNHAFYCFGLWIEILRIASGEKLDQEQRGNERARSSPALRQFVAAWDGAKRDFSGKCEACINATGLRRFRRVLDPERLLGARLLTFVSGMRAE